jgi:hypothetical protein
MANLLVDPGAEAQTISGSGNGVGGWTLFNGMAFNNTVAHSGSWSIGTTAGGGWSVPGAYQQFTASPGQQFTLSGWGYVPTVLGPEGPTGFPWVGLQISYFNGATDLGTVETGGAGAYSTPASKIGPGETAGVWKFLTVTATAPAGATSVQGFAIILDPVATTGYLDDMNMVLVPEPGTIGLALTGLLGLAAFVWKKHRA